MKSDLIRKIEKIWGALTQNLPVVQLPVGRGQHIPWALKNESSYFCFSFTIYKPRKYKSSDFNYVLSKKND